MVANAACNSNSDHPTGHDTEAAVTGAEPCSSTRATITVTVIVSQLATECCVVQVFTTAASAKNCD